MTQGAWLLRQDFGTRLDILYFTYKNVKAIQLSECFKLYKMQMY